MIGGRTRGALGRGRCRGGWGRLTFVDAAWERVGQNGRRGRDGMTVELSGGARAEGERSAAVGRTAAMNILVLNAGSSTLKFRLLKMGNGPAEEGLLARGLVEKWGSPEARLKLTIEG